ncbi:hypothetical protein ScalyP_jg11249 [Parmales sp. scaly parma]|nr:hypothetical protein ScalyP_jg11249 [Parmales sp. scaly parma]
MDFAKSFMGEIDHEYHGDGEAEDPNKENIIFDNTLAPEDMKLKCSLLERKWTFNEVVWIRGSSSVLTRQELCEAVSDSKGVPVDRVECCFFDEDELSHPTVGLEMLGAAGAPGGDVVCVWAAKYEPANHVRQSRKWVKIKKKLENMPSRKYLITAIRENALADDGYDESIPEDEVADVKAIEEEHVWMPPAYDESGIKTGEVVKKKRR